MTDVRWAGDRRGRAKGGGEGELPVDYKDVKPKVNVDERRDCAAKVLSRKGRGSSRNRVSLHVLRLTSVGFSSGRSESFIRVVICGYFRDVCYQAGAKVSRKVHVKRLISIGEF